MPEKSEVTPAAADELKNGAGFAREIGRFTHQVESLLSSFPKVMGFVEGLVGEAQSEFLGFLKTNAKETHTDGDKISFRLEGKAASQSMKLRRSAASSVRAYILLRRSFLISLISQYDSFVGRLLHEIFFVKPELLSASEKAFTFAELLKFNSVDEARKSIVEREVESVIRKSHADQFAWLERALNLPLRENLDAWPTFIEITERRNLFVHCDGVVSSQYIQVCRLHKVSLAGDASVGAQLDISKEYFEAACNCVFEIAVKLAQVAWRKLLPDTLDKADAALNQVCFDLLLQQQLNLAARILDFGCDILKKHGSENVRRCLVLNRAQAYKWLGKPEECQKILQGEDWSACDYKFRIGVAVLSDDYDDAVSLMPHLKSDSEFPGAYRDWPIFRRFRESPEFLASYEKVYAKPFAIEQVTKSDGTSTVTSDPTQTDPA